MDLVKFNQYYYQLAIDELTPRICRYSGLDKEKVSTVPTSIDVFNRTDVNVVTKTSSSHPMSWYKGPTVSDIIRKIAPIQPESGNLLMPIETVYLKRIVNAPLILTGRIVRGKIAVGQNVQVIPLYNGSTSIQRPKKIVGRIKSIRPRGKSRKLPWIGEILPNKENHDLFYEAGQVVGLDLHLNPKFTWAKENIKYFKRGCIVTEPDEKIDMGTILRAEIFVPIYSRALIPGDTWVVYLFGKNKGDALLLSYTQKEGPFPTEDGEEFAGYFAEIQILLSFAMSYPVTNGKTDTYNKDIALRHQESFCGGKVLDLIFPDCIEISWSNDDKKISIETMSHIFSDLSRLNKISCKWKAEQDVNKIVTVTISNPSIADIHTFYSKIDRLMPDLSILRVSINAE